MRLEEYTAVKRLAWLAMGIYSLGVPLIYTVPRPHDRPNART